MLLGESILMCKASELKRGQNLIQNPLDSVRSSLIQLDKETKNEFLRLTASLKRAILEVNFDKFLVPLELNI